MHGHASVVLITNKRDRSRRVCEPGGVHVERKGPRMRQGGTRRRVTNVPHRKALGSTAILILFSPCLLLRVVLYCMMQSLKKTIYQFLSNPFIAHYVHRLKEFHLTGALSHGRFVGSDDHGNRYYEKTGPEAIHCKSCHTAACPCSCPCSLLSPFSSLFSLSICII